MTKPNVAKFMKNVAASVSRHSPEILTGLGVAGMVTTTVLAVKATPKALKLIEEKKKMEEVEKLTPMETVKTTWKCYIPSVITGTVSVACVIGASSVNAKRNAALATAYKLSETALTEYREKVVETLGEKKEKAIREDIDKDRVQKNPVNTSEVIITDKGNTLCLDPISKRYFRTDIDRIKKAENMLNKRMLHDMFGYVSLSELYSELGLDSTDISDDLGWNIERGMIDIDFSPQIATNGEPCLALEFLVAPKYGYDKFS